MILYSTHCTKCQILEAALKEHNIPYEVCDDVNKMKALGFTSAPMLGLNDGRMLSFSEAMDFVMGGNAGNATFECEDCK